MRLLSLLALLTVAPPLAAQGFPAAAEAYLGDWTTYSDETGEAQVVVRLSRVGDTVEGRIVRVLPSQQYPRPQFQCDDCEGQYQNVDLRTVRLIYDMRWDGERFSGGRIVDPSKDKTYKALLTLDGPDRLRVRGYIGVKALGRTQVWRRNG